MADRSTLTLDPEVLAFLHKMGGTNPSTYLNVLLKREQQRVLEQALLDANREEACLAYQQELATWERILADELESSDVPSQ